MQSQMLLQFEQINLIRKSLQANLFRKHRKILLKMAIETEQSEKVKIVLKKKNQNSVSLLRNQKRRKR